jgi:hypothetical protein
MLKGKSVIELTNVKTGEVEKYENPNIITDGVQKYINALFRFGGHSTSTVMWKEIFGGIRLYDNNLEAVASNYTYPSVDVAKLTGYASITQKPSTTTDTMRGNLNTDETKELDNGVQIVYDFATSEANGQIGCCCLTTDYGGQYAVAPRGGGTAEDSVLDYINERKKVFYKREQDSEGNYVIKMKTFGERMSVARAGTNLVTLQTSAMPKTSGDFFLNGDEYASFQRKTSAATGTLNIYSLKTGEIVQTISVQNDNGLVLRGLTDDYVYFCDHNGYAKELIQYSRKNTSDVKKLSEVADFYAYGIFYLSNGMIATTVEQNKTVIVVSEKSFNYEFLQGQLPHGWDEFAFFYSKSYHCTANPNLLMTINNLETPVTKTADKTMKITYTLLESDEATE